MSDLPSAKMAGRPLLSPAQAAEDLCISEKQLRAKDRPSI